MFLSVSCRKNNWSFLKAFLDSDNYIMCSSGSYIRKRTAAKGLEQRYKNQGIYFLRVLNVQK